MIAALMLPSRLIKSSSTLSNCQKFRAVEFDLKYNVTLLDVRNDRSVLANRILSKIKQIPLAPLLGELWQYISLMFGSTSQHGVCTHNFKVAAVRHCRNHSTIN